MSVLNEMAGNALKSVAAALTLFVLTRIMGKKQIAQLTYFDYVIGISIGSIAASVSVERNIPLLAGGISMVIWAAIAVVTGLISLHSIKGRKFLDGTPAVLV